ncbi:hypothetical protein DFH07DRAFT_151776 [Mycena maculata]|uniref:Uncharacterized protein n=1 Tax=Mycena maculata TaxID=230809 RepID=A0AAD7MTL6_9AGAR|nr:hypothetical protein DFH07DRAFT_151776 [Mycena maculata]
MASILRPTLTAVIVESCLYGILFVLFVVVLYFRRTGTNSIVLLGIMGLFVMITTHWIITLYRTFRSVLELGGAAESFLIDLSSPTYLAHTVLLTLSIALADTIVIHRLLSVWAHRRDIIIFPNVMLIGQAVAGIGVIVEFAHWNSQSLDPIETFYSLSNIWVICNL